MLCLWILFIIKACILTFFEIWKIHELYLVRLFDKRKKFMIAMQNIAESQWKVQLSMSKSLVLRLKSKELLVKTPALFIKKWLTFSKFWNFVCFLVGSIFRLQMSIHNFFFHHSNSQLLRNHMHINYLTLKISNEG